MLTKVMFTPQMNVAKLNFTLTCNTDHMWQILDDSVNRNKIPLFKFKSTDL